MYRKERVKVMKSIASTLLVIVLLVGLLGCSREETMSKATGMDQQSLVQAREAGKLIAITSTYPLYEFTKRIGGDEVAVFSLLPPGADAHDYEPTVKQMMAIADADIFAYNGAGFELWIDKLLKALETDHSLHIINGTEGLPLLDSNHGDQDEHEHHDHTWYADAWYWLIGLFGFEHDHHHHHGDYDPHVWLDPNLAMLQAQIVANSLKTMVPEKADYFERNFADVKMELEELDHAFVKGLEDLEQRAFVVSHAGYGYLAARYNLEQIAITGIHPGSEPSSREVRRIIDFLRETDNRHVFFETTISNKTAQVIADEVNAKVLVLHPVENLTAIDVENDETYFSLMYQNLENLIQALGK